MTRDMICTPCVARHWDSHLAMHLQMLQDNLQLHQLWLQKPIEIRQPSKAKHILDKNMVLYVSLRFILIWTTSADVWFLTSSKHVSNTQAGGSTLQPSVTILRSAEESAAKSTQGSATVLVSSAGCGANSTAEGAECVSGKLNAPSVTT